IGLVGHIGFFVWIGIASVAFSSLLTVWRHASSRAPQLWSVCVFTLVVGLALVALPIYGIVETHAPLPLKLCTLISLLPAAYFLYLSWSVAYFARHSVQAPTPQRLFRVLRFLSRNT